MFSSGLLIIILIFLVFLINILTIWENKTGRISSFVKKFIYRQKNEVGRNNVPSTSENDLILEEVQIEDGEVVVKETTVITDTPSEKMSSVEEDLYDISDIVANIRKADAGIIIN